MELIAAAITSIDVVVIFALLQVRKGKFVLALWTSFLNMVFPFIGFTAGHFSAHLFEEWSSLLSGVLLALIGIHMLIQDNNPISNGKKLSPIVIAMAVSLDTFSVSVSFGMLHFNKALFIIASGAFTLILSYSALLFGRKLGLENGNIINFVAGIALIVIGVMSCVR